MKQIARLSLLAFLVLGASCSFSTPEKGSSSFTPAIDTSDKGYLKISRMTTGYYTTDYIFVSEEGYQFLAKGKNAQGKDASYTYSAEWESSDESIFRVSNMGIVRAISDGTATLRATYGPYHDEIEVKVATYATEHTVSETETYYRTKRTYEMPYHVEPENALVEYTFSIEDSIEVVNGHSFIPKKAGEITVQATVYVNEFGLPRSDTFVLNVIENEKPYFIYEEKEIDELELDVAVHKYKTIDWNALGISAFAGDDDSDITSSINVKSGTYDLSTVGEYSLTISATNKGVEATIPLRLNITEKEPVKTDIYCEPLEIENFRWTMASNLKSITFSATAILPDGYEDYWGSVDLSVQCEVKRKVSGQKMTLSKTSARYFDKTSEKRISVSVTCETENNLEMRAGDENVTNIYARAYWYGIGYNYIVYTE